SSKSRQFGRRRRSRGQRRAPRNGLRRRKKLPLPPVAVAELIGMPVASKAPHPRAVQTPPSPRERGEGRGEGRAQRVCVGVITGPQGVHGAVRIKSFTDVPENIAGYGPLEDEAGTRRFTLCVVGMGKGVLIAQLAGVGDRDHAEALRGLRLYVRRSALPETE